MIERKTSTIVINLILFTFLRPCGTNNEFFISSTSQPPTHNEKILTILSNIQERMNLNDNLRENNEKLKTLENKLEENLISINIQINRIQKYLEKLAHVKNCTEIPKNCKEVQYKGGKPSGMYLIQPDFAPKPFTVWCDMNTKGGGWTYFLNRFDGSQDFYLNWDDYKNGFGKQTKEFWLGLENLFYLTGYESNELLVQLTDWENKTVFAFYDAFMISSEEEGYSLRVLGNYEGDAGDSLTHHEGMKFTTKDKDQDRRNNENCAIQEKGGWWYNSCTLNNLTARYLRGNVTDSDRWQIMYWETFRGSSYSLKEAKMMVRPKTNVV